MTVATSASILTQAASGSPAGIDAWTGELVGQLIACGLLQTQDSGQLTITGSGGTATTNATQPAGTGVGNAVGHILLTFTDSLAKGGLSTTALVAAGSGYTNGTQTGLVVTGVTSGATSARATVVVSGGTCANATITTAGSGYIAGEKLTMNVPGGSNAAWMPTILTSGTPVVFRLDFGGGGAVTSPQVWITVGSGSNGSGTINGSAGTTAMTQVAALAGVAPNSTTTVYDSFFCWNSTYGFCKAVFKVGAGSAGSVPAGGFYIFRSNDTNGAATATGVMLLTNSSSTTGGANTSGSMQCATYASGLITSIAPTTMSAANCSNYPALVIQGGTICYGVSSTLSGGNVTVFNIICLVNGVFFYSAYVGIALLTDIPQGNSASLAIIGATPLTFLGDSEGVCGSTFLSGATATFLGTVSVWQ